jgi:hypothetical protein
MSALAEVESLLTGDALGLPPEDEEEAKYYLIAYKVCEGDFRRKLIRQQADYVRKQAEKLKRLTDKKNHHWLAAEFSEDAVGRDQDLARIRKDQDEHKTKNLLREYEKRIEEFTRHGRRLVREEESATEQMWEYTRYGDNGPEPEAQAMKRQLLDLARQIDPQGADAAEALGYFYMRSPAFLYQYRLTDFDRDGQNELERSYQSRNEGKLPPVDKDYIDLPPHKAFLILEGIDCKLRNAAHQDDVACVELLSILGNFALPRTVHDHLTRVVLELKESVIGIDKTYENLPDEHEMKWKCPACANWPDLSHGKKVFNQNAYHYILKDIRRLCAKKTAQLSSLKIVNAIQKHSDGEDASVEQKIWA